jgi:serine protease
VNRNGLLKLHIYRLLDEESSSYLSDIVTAIQSCADAGSKVVSMSFGAPVKRSLYLEQVFQKYYDEGIIFVAAAGNNGSSYYSYPVLYDSAISVAAIDENK